MASPPDDLASSDGIQTVDAATPELVQADLSEAVHKEGAGDSGPAYPDLTTVGLGDHHSDTKSIIAPAQTSNVDVYHDDIQTDEITKIPPAAPAHTPIDLPMLLDDQSLPGKDEKDPQRSVGVSSCEDKEEPSSLNNTSNSFAELCDPFVDESQDNNNVAGGSSVDPSHHSTSGETDIISSRGLHMDEHLNRAGVTHSSLFADLGAEAPEEPPTISPHSPSKVPPVVSGPAVGAANSSLLSDDPDSFVRFQQGRPLHAIIDIPNPPIRRSGSDEVPESILASSQQPIQSEERTQSPPRPAPLVTSDQIRSVLARIGRGSQQQVAEYHPGETIEQPRPAFRRWGQQTESPAPQIPSSQEPLKLGDPSHSAAASGRHRSPQYAFPAHADSDTLAKEIEEFYSYVETPQLLENRQSWEEWYRQRQKEEREASPNRLSTAGDISVAKEETSESFDSSSTSSTAWTPLPSSVRQKHIASLLSQLSSPDPDVRLTASRAFLYLLQGSFADTHGAEHQEHWIQLNARLSREEGALGNVYDALKKSLWKHDFLTSLPDHVQDTQTGQAATALNESTPLLTPQSKAEYLDEVNLELTLNFAQLYILIETGRRDDEEGNDSDRLPDDLMALDPPLPIFLWLVVAGLREKSAKGFPVKKLLLCLWKSLLTCLGGHKELERCKALARQVEGLPPAPTTRSNTNWPAASPTATEAQQSQSVGSGPIARSKLSETMESSMSHNPGCSSQSQRLSLGKPRKRQATKATPKDFEVFRDELAVKYPTYAPPRRTPADLPIEKLASALEPVAPRRLTFANGENKSIDVRGEEDAISGGPGPPTPAPSPPPSPRPNKQKYQTDQTRPFVFPFSASVQGDRMVPYSIEEADRLYAENMYVSSEMWQMWRTREELSREEKGLATEQPKPSRHQLHRGGGPGSDLKTDPLVTKLTTRLGSSLSLRKLHLSSTTASQWPSLSDGPPSRSSSHDGKGSAGLHALALSRSDPPLESAGIDSPGRLTTATPPAFTPGGGSPRFTAIAMSDVDSSEGPASAQPAPVDPEKSFFTRGEPTYERLIEVEAEIQATLMKAEGDHLLAVLDNDRYLRTVVCLQRQIADVRRLQRVDLLYKAVLSNLQNAVVVLLKLLLATVTAPNTQLGQDGNSNEAPASPTVEDVDILRHREITTKAISAILLLSLKWFKASHAMKFHHLSQFLVDSNAMLLILKMFGLQEVGTSIRAVNEASDYNFFNFCEVEGLKDAGDIDIGIGLSLPAVKPAVGSVNGFGNAPADTSLSLGPDSSVAPPLVDDAGLIHEYCFRNFFSIINFTRILQKVTKRKVHRILLLVQYKSSAILKRSLKVPHPTLQLYVLKVIKSQVPFCGRKWRQSNMKVITGIYLNCRPELRDEWLSSDKDGEIYESLIQEQALRSLVKYYIASRFGVDADQSQQQQQGGKQVARRGQGAQNGWEAGPGEQALSEGPLGGEQGPNGTEGVGTVDGIPEQPQRWGFFEANLFLQPLKRGGRNAGGGAGPGAAAYIPDDIVEGYLGDYDEILNEVFGTTTTDEQFYRGTGAIDDIRHGQDLNISSLSRSISPPPRSPSSTAPSSSPGSGDGRVGGGAGGGLTTQGARQAWDALGEILGQNDEGSSSISDSESIASIGELDFSNQNNSAGEAGSGGHHVPLVPSGVAGDDLNDTSSLSAPEEEGTSNWEHLSPREMRILSSTAAAEKHRDRSRSPSPSLLPSTTVGSLGSPTNVLGTGRITRPSSSGTSPRSIFGGAGGTLESPRSSPINLGEAPHHSQSHQHQQTREIRAMPLPRRSSSSSHTTSMLSSPALLLRAYSDSQPLRPVLDFEAMDLEAARRAARIARGVSGEVDEDEDEDEVEEDDEDDGQGLGGPRSPNKVGGIDEVEHVFGQ